MTSVVAGCFDGPVDIDHSGGPSVEQSVTMQDALIAQLPVTGNADPNFLTSPYVLGSDITVDPGSRQDTADWSLQSSDPTVMTIVQRTTPSSLEWKVIAMGIGSSTLSVIDEAGQTIDSIAWGAAFVLGIGVVVARRRRPAASGADVAGQ